MVRRASCRSTGRPPIACPTSWWRFDQTSTWRYDIGRKTELYQQHGVTELWLVDTASRSVLVYRGDDRENSAPSDTLTSPLLPGFAASVGALIPAA